MKNETFIYRSIPHIKRWFFSFLLIIPTWILVEQFWLALNTNIMLAVDYPYPFFLWPIYFVLDNLTLLVHEAGHSFFRIFGWRFLEILGGSLYQIILPFCIFLFAWIKEKRIIAQFSLFWLGFAWLDTAAYCADAYEQNLPLIGNLPKSSHDFLNILSELNILDMYSSIAWGMFTTGLIILVFGILWPYQEYRKTEYVVLSINV